MFHHPPGVAGGSGGGGGKGDGGGGRLRGGGGEGEGGGGEAEGGGPGQCVLRAQMSNPPVVTDPSERQLSVSPALINTSNGRCVPLYCSVPIVT